VDRFEGLLIENIPRLRRYAWALTGDSDHADDLVQDCLTRAVSRRRLWISAKGMRPWLFTILRNLHRNALSKSAREPTLTVLDDQKELANQSYSAEGLQKLAELDKALQKLSVEHREILLLVGLEQLTCKETASLLELPLGTVMSRLSRARAQLRDFLADAPSTVLKKII